MATPANIELLVGGWRDPLAKPCAAAVSLVQERVWRKRLAFKSWCTENMVHPLVIGLATGIGLLTDKHPGKSQGARKG